MITRREKILLDFQVEKEKRKMKELERQGLADNEEMLQKLDLEMAQEAEEWKSYTNPVTEEAEEEENKLRNALTSEEFRKSIQRTYFKERTVINFDTETITEMYKIVYEQSLKWMVKGYLTTREAEISIAIINKMSEHLGLSKNQPISTEIEENKKTIVQWVNADEKNLSKKVKKAKLKMNKNGDVVDENEGNRYDS
jgi:hypothetical protein